MFCFISVGYASLTDELSISGTVSYTKPYETPEPGTTDASHDIASTDRGKELYDDEKLYGSEFFMDFIGDFDNRLKKIVFGYWDSQDGWPGYGGKVAEYGYTREIEAEYQNVTFLDNKGKVKDDYVKYDGGILFKDNKNYKSDCLNQSGYLKYGYNVSQVKWFPDSRVRAYIVEDTVYVLVIDVYPNIVLSKKDYEAMADFEEVYIHIHAHHETVGAESPNILKGYSNLKKVDISGLDLTNYKGSVGEIISETENLEEVTIGKYLQEIVNNKETKSLSGLFSGCGEKLEDNKYLKVYATGVNPNYTADFSKVDDLSSMFSGLKRLKTVDFTGVKFKDGANISNMFDGCENLQTIYTSEDWSNVQGTDVFNDCKSLVGGSGTAYHDDHKNADYARIDYGTSRPGYFTNPNAAHQVSESYELDLSGIENMSVETSEMSLMTADDVSYLLVKMTPYVDYQMPDAVHVIINGSELLISVSGDEVSEEVLFDAETNTLMICKNMLSDNAVVQIKAAAYPSYVLELSGEHLTIDTWRSDEGLSVQMIPDEGFMMPESFDFMIKDNMYTIYTASDANESNPAGMGFDSIDSVLFISKVLLPEDGSIISTNVQVVEIDSEADEGLMQIEEVVENLPEANQTEIEETQTEDKIKEE